MLTIDHRRIPDADLSIPAEYETGLQRGRLGEWLQAIIDAGWGVRIGTFQETDTRSHVYAQLTTGRWSKGTYRQIGATDPFDIERAVVIAYRAWRDRQEANDANFSQRTGQSA